MLNFLILLAFVIGGVFSADCWKPLYYVAPLETTSTTVGPTTTKRYRVYCPDGSIEMSRTATAENFYSGKICIQPVSLPVATKPSEASNVCKSVVRNDSFLTAPENPWEPGMFIGLAGPYYYSRGISYFTTVVDGRRKEECMAPETFNVSPCTASGTFEMENLKINTDYLFSHWGTNQPSNSVVDGEVESCIGMGFKDVVDSDVAYYDIFCDKEVSPFLDGDNEPEYTAYTFFCGFYPLREEY